MGYRLEAHIAVNKNRVAEFWDDHFHQKQVYLKDGTQFQLELFNGEQSTYAAEIWLNEKKISDRRLVLQPGQRIFLDRYLDKQKKFKFSTYIVEDAKESRNAIAKNGDIVIKWFREDSSKNYDYWNTPWITYYPPDPPTVTPAPYYFTTNTGTGGVLNVRSTTTSGACLTSAGVTYNSGPSTATIAGPTIETGRVQEGSHSNQNLQNVNVQIESYVSHYSRLKILPYSHKPVTVDEAVRTYCTECGRRQKKGWKFCPSCGTANN